MRNVKIFCGFEGVLLWRYAPGAQAAEDQQVQRVSLIPRAQPEQPGYKAKGCGWYGYRVANTVMI